MPDPGEEFNFFFFIKNVFLHKRLCQHGGKKEKISNLGREGFLPPYTSLSQSTPKRRHNWSSR